MGDIDGWWKDHFDELLYPANMSPGEGEASGDMAGGAHPYPWQSSLRLSKSFSGTRCRGWLRSALRC